MEAGKPADMSVLDLVEDFQALDADEMMKGDATTKGRFGSITLERSIGGDDISDIAPADGDDDEEDQRSSDDDASRDILQVTGGPVAEVVQQPSAGAGATPVTPQSPPPDVLCPSCFTKHDGRSKFCKFCGELVRRDPASSKDYAIGSSVNLVPASRAGTGNVDSGGVSDEREDESEAWDSSDSEPARAAIAPARRFDSAEEPHHSDGGSGSPLSDECSNPNMSSPTRPAEASSDWDCVEGGIIGIAASSESDDSRVVRDSDVESDSESGPAKPGSVVSPSRRVVGVIDKEKESPVPSSDGRASAPNPPDCKKLPRNCRPTSSSQDGRESAPSKYSQEPSTLSSPLSSRRPSEAASSSASLMQSAPEGATIVGSTNGYPRNREGRREDRPQPVLVANQCSSSAAAEAEAKGRAAAEEAAAAAATTIKTLQSELSLLKDLVMRSEQKREEELGELRSRLEAQERYSRRPSSHDELQQKTSPRESGSAGVGVGVDEQDTEASGGVTPPGAGVHNPFATQEGGESTTPRDHFPAFEDALHDGESDDCVPPNRKLDGDNVGEGGEEYKSMHSDGFDFSIDTLSHINNHTDFGTVVPVTTTAAMASSSVANPATKSGRRTHRDPGQHPVAPGLATSPLPGEQRSDEIFDAQGTAAEEAFFADARATASLQTPVKHVLAAGGAVAGVACRGARPQDRRGARGTPAERTGAPGEGSTVPRAAQQQAAARTGRGFKEDTITSGEPEELNREQLCMADFFAGAAEQIADNPEVSEGRGGSPIAADEGGVDPGRRNVALRAHEAKVGRVGVDAGTQTTWSFSGHEGVRFLSTPVRTPLHTLVESERGVSPGEDELVGWGLRWPSGRKSDLPLIEGGLEREGEMDTHTHSGKETAPFYTPQRSKPPSRQAFQDSSESTIDAQTSQGSTFFDSPGLSPIVDSRARSRSENVDIPDYGGRIDTIASGGSRGSIGSKKGAPSVEQGQVPQEMTRGLSPIQSECGAYPQSAGRGVPSLSRAGSSASRVETAGVRGGEASACAVIDREAKSASQDSNGERPFRADGGWDFSKGNERGKRGSPGLEGGQQWTPAAARGPVRNKSTFVASCADTSGTSHLRASSTLETMALLEDTSRSFSSFSRAGSFPGDLFADARLRDSSTFHSLRRQDVTASQESNLKSGGKWLIAPSPPQNRTERRVRSAPTLLPEQAVGSPDRRGRQPREGPQAAAVEAEGIPPAVVGAWLAAALEGFYVHNAEISCGTNANAKRERQVGSWGAHGVREVVPSFSGPLDLDSALERSPLTGVRRRRGNPAALLKEARMLGIQDEDVQFAYARAVAAPVPAYPICPGDSPPPPPPPPPLDRVIDGSTMKTSNEEEEIFYQRQRLIHRAVTAAAKHGGVMMQLPPRGACTASRTAGDARTFGAEEDRQQEQENYGDDDDWRRHSDPLYWQTTPSIPATAVSDVAGRAGGKATALRTGAIIDARAATGTGTSPYLRRHTSGYWRDRLGMTQ